jgi:hypothetical protein
MGKRFLDGFLEMFWMCIAGGTRETCVEFITSETNNHNTNKLLLDRIDMRNQGQFGRGQS